MADVVRAWRREYGPNGSRTDPPELRLQPLSLTPRRLSACRAPRAVAQKQSATGIRLSDEEVAQIREKIKLSRPDAI